MNETHNVWVGRAKETAKKALTDATVAQIAVDLSGDWRLDASLPQFGAKVKYPKGEVVLESDFSPALGGDGRAPSPLLYCFFGALSCYASTFAIQAAILGIKLKSLKGRLRLKVDLRGALDIKDVKPFDKFQFDLDVETDASLDEINKIKELAYDRCPAIWTMNNQVPHEICVTKI